jgi:PadR family transcriptional regulator PadR
MKLDREMIRGAGPTAVLQLLADGEKYGYELIESLSGQTDGVLAMGHSTLYPMLYNLEAKGVLTSREKASESGRRRKYYRLTAKGKKKLNSDRAQWTALVKAMGAIGVHRQRNLAPGMST